MKPSVKHIAALTTGAILLCSFGTSSAADQSLSPLNLAVEQIETTSAITANDRQATSLASYYNNSANTRGGNLVSLYAKDTAAQASRDYVADYLDKRYRFSSEESRDLFLANPDRYLPQFNGFTPNGPLAKNNLRIGNINQYSPIEDEIKFSNQASSKSYYGNETDNIFLRAQLDF